MLTKSPPVKPSPLTSAALNSGSKPTSKKFERYTLFGIFVYITYLFTVRMLTPEGLQLDEAEQLVTSQTIAWGYGSQPPLFSWLQRGFFEVFGWNVFSISLFRFGLIGIAIYGSFLMAKRLGLTEHGLALGVFSLALLPQYSWTAINDLSHTLILWAASVFTLLSYHSLTQQWNIKNAIYLAIWIFIGMLSKHSYGLVLAVLFIHSFTTPIWKSITTKPLPFLIVILGAVCAAPHYYWIVAHYPWSIESTLYKAGFDTDESGALYLAKTLLIFFVPLLILLPIFKLRQWNTLKSCNPINSQVLRFNLAFIGLSVLCLFVLTLVGFTTFRERWLIPFFPMISIVCLAFINWASVKKWQLVLAYLWCGLMLLLTLFLFSIRGFESQITGNLNRFERSAFTLDKVVDKQANIVSADFHAGGLLKLYQPTRNVSLYSRIQPDEIHHVLTSSNAFIWSENKHVKGMSIEQQQNYWSEDFSANNSPCTLTNTQKFTETKDTFYLAQLDCSQ